MLPPVEEDIFHHPYVPMLGNRGSKRVSLQASGLYLMRRQHVPSRHEQLLGLVRARRHLALVALQVILDQLRRKQVGMSG